MRPGPVEKRSEQGAVSIERARQGMSKPILWLDVLVKEIPHNQSRICLGKDSPCLAPTQLLVKCLGGGRPLSGLASILRAGRLVASEAELLSRHAVVDAMPLALVALVDMLKEHAHLLLI